MTQTPKSNKEVRQPVNEVRLVGRISGEPVSRELPSGDRVVTFRTVVPRSSAEGRGQVKPHAAVDTIDCAAWSAPVQRKAVRLSAGTEVEILGQLRRRFWRTPGGPASRYEVDVTELRRC